MAYSFVNFGSKSPGDNITVPFPFQSREEVAVRVNGTLVATDKYSWVNNGLLLCLTGFPSGAGEVRRSTLSEEARVSLTGTATLDYPGINTQTNQLLFIGQEASDRVEDLENRGWVTSDQDDGGTITKGDNDVLIKYDADGNLVPAELTVGDMVQVSAIAAAISLVASKAAEIEEVYDNLTPIQTVATNIANVNAVGPQVVKVASVADNLDIVEDVADNLADINALAPHATAVGALGARVAGLDALTARTSQLDTLALVSGYISDLGPQAANMGLLVPAVDDLANLAPRVGDLEDLGTQAANLALLGPQVAAIAALAPRVGDLEDLGPRAGDLEDLGPRAGDLLALAPRVADLEDLGPRAADLLALGPKATALGLLADRTAALDALSTTERLSVLDSLYPVAGAMDLLGPRHFDLEALGPIADDLEALGLQATNIGTLATRTATLDALGSRTTQLDALGPRAGDLLALAPRVDDLEDLGPRAGDLLALGVRAADLEALGPHADDLDALAGGLQVNIDAEEADRKVATLNAGDIPDGTPISGGRFADVSYYKSFTRFTTKIVEGLTKYGQREIDRLYVGEIRGPSTSFLAQSVPPFALPNVGPVLYSIRGSDNKIVFAISEADGSLWSLDPVTHVLTKVAGGSNSVNNVYSVSGGLAVNTDQNVIYLFFIWGQSWDYGGSSASSDSVLSSTPTHPGYALMFDNGQATKTARIIQNSPVAAYTLGDFIDLVEASPATGTWESRASGFANNFITRHNTAVGWKPKVVMAISAVGGAPYASIRRGQAAYSAMIGAVEKAVSLAAQRGLGERVVVNVLSNHGQADADAGVKAEDYARFLTEFSEHVNADFRQRTGQQEPVRVYMTQPDRSGNSIMNFPEVGIGMRRAARYDPRIVLVGPGYAFEHATGDAAHLSSYGYHSNGTTEADVAVADLFGVGKPPLEIINAWRVNATTIRIAYSRDITIDTSGDIITPPGDGGCGFILTDGSFTIIDINSVTAIDARTIEIAHDAVGTSPLLQYARRGLIRESTSFGNDFYGDPLYHWATVQTVSL